MDESSMFNEALFSKEESETQFHVSLTLALDEVNVQFHVLAILPLEKVLLPTYWIYILNQQSFCKTYNSSSDHKKASACKVYTNFTLNFGTNFHWHFSESTSLVLITSVWNIDSCSGKDLFFTAQVLCTQAPPPPPAPKKKLSWNPKAHYSVHIVYIPSYSCQYQYHYTANYYYWNLVLVQHNIFKYIRWFIFTYSPPERGPW
jgi:hypothetical protein